MHKNIKIKDKQPVLKLTELNFLSRYLIKRIFYEIVAVVLINLEIQITIIITAYWQSDKLRNCMGIGQKNSDDTEN